jgi:hypothetical protein
MKLGEVPQRVMHDAEIVAEEHGWTISYVLNSWGYPVEDLKKGKGK